MSHHMIKADFDTYFAYLYDLAFSWNITTELEALYVCLECRRIKDIKKVCDAGAGTGRFTIPLVDLGMEVTAIEPNEAMLNRLVMKRSSPNLIPTKHRFEKFRSEIPFDAVIAMTDTVSDVWPITSLKSFLNTAENFLVKGGVFVADIAIWGNQKSQSRSESWIQETADGPVSAICKAIVHTYNEQMFRVEELQFCLDTQSVKWAVSKQSVMHAFTLEAFETLVKDANLNPITYVTPTARKLTRKEAQKELRLLIACRKER